LDLPGYGTILEIAQHGGNQVVVSRVEVVDDGFGQLVGRIQSVQELAHGLGYGEVADGVEAGIGAQFGEKATVVVADSAVMQLLGPAFFVVHDGEFVHHGRLELADFLRGEWLTTVYLIKYGVNVGLRVVFGVEFFDTVIAEFATNGSEEVVAHLQGVNDVGKAADAHAGNGRQLFDVGSESSRIFHGHSLVGTPGGQHLDAEAFLGQGYVVFEAVDGIIGGANRFHVEFLHQAPG